MNSHIAQSEQILAQKYKYLVINLIRNNTYLARDKNSGSRVIIKRFSFGTVDNWQDFNQIENELKILKRLNYSQIPEYIDSFQVDNSLYLVQEFIKGEELSTQKVYLEKEIIDITKQILSILIYLQSLNPPVIHHDLKPENILVNKEGKVYLVDFGISKEVTGKTIGITTQFAGTNGFIAPEKMLGKKSDIRSDLYSLGVTLACLITRTPSSKAVELLNDDFELRSEILLEHDYSLNLSNWVENLVKRKPENRFRDAKAALKRLDILASSNRSPCVAPRKGKFVLISQDRKRAIEAKEAKKTELPSDAPHVFNINEPDPTRFVPQTITIQGENYVLLMVTKSLTYEITGKVVDLVACHLKSHAISRLANPCCALFNGSDYYEFGHDYLSLEAQETLVEKINLFLDRFK